MSCPADARAEAVCLTQHPLVQRWADAIRSSSKQAANDQPNYYLHDPASLVGTSSSLRFCTGTGDALFERLLPSLQEARTEILFVTCFWARSPSLTKLGDTLRALSRRVVDNGEPKIQVRICFSSLSVTQKLFQTASVDGRRYAPEEWEATLGLPPPDELEGLEMRIKSVFVRPFSVMHPKFVVVDRQTVWLPSCNVSWEEWFEGCAALTGPVVGQFVRFWDQFWRDTDDVLMLEGKQLEADVVTGRVSEVVDEEADADSSTVQPSHQKTTARTGGVSRTFQKNGVEISTVFLPSPHHANPRFQFAPWKRAVPPPPTPLNIFLLELLSCAQSSVYIQTPNLTSPPVLTAIIDTLRRGVDMHIVTSENLMVMEQLATAGTTTARCVKKLVKRYKQLLTGFVAHESAQVADLEVGFKKPGNLHIEYYEPRDAKLAGEPKQSHLKLTAVDDEWIVLGSGNLDRASWYTSQELGVAFFDKETVQEILKILDTTLQGRRKEVYHTSYLDVQKTKSKKSKKSKRSKSRCCGLLTA